MCLKFPAEIGCTYFNEKKCWDSWDFRTFPAYYFMFEGYKNTIKCGEGYGSTTMRGKIKTQCVIMQFTVFRRLETNFTTALWMSSIVLQVPHHLTARRTSDQYTEGLGSVQERTVLEKYYLCWKSTRKWSFWHRRASPKNDRSEVIDDRKTERVLKFKLASNDAIAVY